MSREAQVRICEQLGVKFPGLTRQKGPRLLSPLPERTRHPVKLLPPAVSFPGGFRTPGSTTALSLMSLKEGSAALSEEHVVGGVWHGQERTRLVTRPLGHTSLSVDPLDD
jgi:hypothetical protein